MAKSFDYIIVGGGNAAGYACRELVAQGVGAGKVGLIQAEPVVPYERPALTKAYLHPPSAKVRARLPGFHTCVGGGGDRQTPEWYAEKGITREEIEAGQLVKALEDLGGKGKAIIVGGGYIGLEVAAALVGWGIETTMVFPEANCMPRLFNAQLGKWLEDEYASRGINIIKGDLVTEFIEAGGSVAGVQLKSGGSLPCNIAVVGVGAQPNVEFCQGLTMEKGGFAVDGSMMTSDPNVFAIGDVCAFPSAYGGLTRCEHVDHARKSAKQAVQAAMGLSPAPYQYLPYFYSRIFEYTDAPIVFNFFGDESGDCQVCSRGDKSVGAIWVKEGKVAGALLMGSPGPSAEDQAKLREVTAAMPAAEDAAAVFANAKL
eukprot:CAMPEP_0168502856 /NCGR_PEP_ID=MMETSP0228-20121227/75549_1 /TAXON_ID=133427 /ORGANISM="Protoceratium reticulatum, Strain CCCM 535 (=CCMP 1889)" /LENGTH=371 /DNA_ID=CAMNT_0008519881 /DNA_START=38 /DNA_END=1153 /DNA_ORIENTATION=+